MLTLGPHIIRHQFPDGVIEETPVRFNFLGPRETTITDGVTIIEETGEVIIELPDGEHRTLISAQNTFALVGWAIRLTEALFIRWNKEDGGKTYRLLPGGVKGPRGYVLVEAPDPPLSVSLASRTPSRYSSGPRCFGTAGNRHKPLLTGRSQHGL